MPKLSKLSELKRKAQASNMHARTLARALDAIHGRGSTQILGASQMAGDSSGAVVLFRRCPGLGIEALLNPYEDGPRFMSLLEGEPMGEAKTVVEATRLVHRCGRR